MSNKAKPSVQSLKSMPADYRFLEDSSSGSSVSVTIPFNNHLKNGVGGVDTGNEDSPYSLQTISNGDESSLVDEDPIVPLPESNDPRWSDTSVYARKKV